MRLDGLVPPRAAEQQEEEGKLTVEDARKVLRAAQMEAVRSKLRKLTKESVTVEEFVEICCESSGGDREQGLGFAKMLDESGTVIVLGNVVLLRPDQVISCFALSLCFLILTFSNPFRLDFLEYLCFFFLQRSF